MKKEGVENQEGIRTRDKARKKDRESDRETQIRSEKTPWKEKDRQGRKEGRHMQIGQGSEAVMKNKASLRPRK